MAHILAVDDSEPMRKLVELVLSKAGHKVVLATDGAEGLKKFFSEKFDLVVTDINMPTLSGFDLICKIREQDSETPIFALTTESDDKMQAKGKNCGANGWIIKPFQPARFIEMISQAI